MRINMGDILQNKLLARRANAPVYRVVGAKAPSGTANLGPGFDVFGLALDLFHDTVEIESVPNGGLTLTVEGVDQDQVSSEVDNNTAGLVGNRVMDAMRNQEGLRIKLTKGIPVGKGLGSSAASAAACALALNEMFRLELSQADLISLTAHGETASAGIAHFDNAAAAVLGGFVVVSQEPLELASFKPPPDLEVAIAIPDVTLPKEKTKTMRDILPEAVDLASLTCNVAHASLFVAGMALSNIEMIGRAMIDLVVEPVRSRTIPMFASVKSAALDAGASGFAISGAGPTVIAICDRKRVNTKDVALAMKEDFEKNDVPCEAYSSVPSSGAAVTEKR